MEDDLNILAKWKTTSILRKVEDDLNLKKKMEDDLNFKVNGRRPKFSVKGKTTSTILQIEDSINLVANGR